MNVVLWIVQGLMAFAFLGAGGMKLALDKEQAKERGQDYVEDFETWHLKAIGLLEISGAIGLIVPALTGIAPTLTPIAATGLSTIMIGAAFTHLRRGEMPNIGINAVLAALTLFVAVGRFAIAPIA